MTGRWHAATNTSCLPYKIVHLIEVFVSSEELTVFILWVLQVSAIRCVAPGNIHTTPTMVIGNFDRGEVELNSQNV